MVLCTFRELISVAAEGHRSDPKGLCSLGQGT